MHSTLNCNYSNFITGSLYVSFIFLPSGSLEKIKTPSVDNDSSALDESFEGKYRKLKSFSEVLSKIMYEQGLIILVLV